MCLLLVDRTEAGNRMAVVGHDMGGVIAMKLAATDERVKSVALISTPGRPLVDVWAENYRFTHGPVSSDAYRAMIDGLLTNGTLPARDVMRPEFQSLLPPNQDAFFKAMFSVDPASEAGISRPCPRPSSVSGRRGGGHQPHPALRQLVA